MIEIDATLLAAHSSEEDAAATFSAAVVRPPLAYLDAAREAPAGVLRPGNAGANTAADHLETVRLALAQLPSRSSSTSGSSSGPTAPPPSTRSPTAATIHLASRTAPARGRAPGSRRRRVEKRGASKRYGTSPGMGAPG